MYVQRIKAAYLPSTFVVNESTNEMWIQLPDKEAAAYDTLGVQCVCTHFPGTSRQEVYNHAFESGYSGIAARDRFVRIADNVKFNGNPDVLNAWLDEKASAGENVTIFYILNKPVETALSETEIAAYRAMHSNYPNTTVLNDSGAHMVVKYAADTKLYIDNKITALLGG